MANIGTNGASLVQTNLTTNGALFAASGGILSSSSTMKITSDVLTNTSQPAFYAYQSTNTTNSTGDSTQYTVVCDTALVNVGTLYNTSTGIFTASVASIWCFSACVSFYSMSTQTVITCFLNGSSKNVNGAYSNPVAATNSAAATNVSVVVPMAAGETFKLIAVCSGGAKTVGISSAILGVSTYFSGVQIA